MQVSLTDIAGISPLIIVCITGIAVMLLEVSLSSKQRDFLAYVTIFGLLLSAVVAYFIWEDKLVAKHFIFNKMLLVDRFAFFFIMLFSVGGALTTLLSINYLKHRDMERGEYYALILFAIAGMIIMAMSTDLLVLFIGLEAMSISIYALACFIRREDRGIEAGLKYFILGAFSSGFLLYGIALIFGTTGSTNLQDIAVWIRSTNAEQILSNNPLLLVGLCLLLTGFGFKIASVPFHMWTPDVYEGAPTPITGFMAVAVKAAAFAVLLRTLMFGFYADSVKFGAFGWETVIIVMAVITMFLGNLVALVQENIKRMLAYSSIAHAGYLLVGVAAAAHGQSAMGSVLYYLLVYTFMNLGAFGIISYLERQGAKRVNVSDYAGVGFKYPFIGFAMMVFMLALAGIPPTAGFFSKFYIFSAAVKADLVYLAIFGVINSLLSVYYYLRVIMYMYMKESDENVETIKYKAQLYLGVLIALILVLKLGIFPNSYLDIAQKSISAVLGG